MIFIHYILLHTTVKTYSWKKQLKKKSFMPDSLQCWVLWSLSLGISKLPPHTLTSSQESRPLERHTGGRSHLGSPQGLCIHI